MAADKTGLSTMMESLFDNGEFADLIVRAGDTEFKVHRSIVCTASSWFRAACTRDFQESKTRMIFLQESAAVVKSLLLFLYGLQHRIREQLVGSFGERIKLAVCIHMAGDKYVCPALSAYMAEELRFQLRFTGDVNEQELVDVAAWAYSQTEGQITDQIYQSLTRATTQRLHSLVAKDESWQRIVSCEAYVSDVMRCVATSRGFFQLSDIVRKTL
ncbi:hypothetical protein CB0940_10511 [Cercospora beticola]|uniref:BTB domain-containing protein n=1 Tax=Cercospora beticola TaxID=122368 RepID=A0A2G5HTE6_CERBT|nr:hypothetical protein CB0940_10511 [Cercospora beticola]PIA95796.1 hypothetical protein CB0940_10511 [Cercospora beticola]WPB07231.1 hypothetical protein RHO25_011892 [Cercospora beticola]CAK1367201.1 unnamed protein product [Cercospora beticola]